MLMSYEQYYEAAEVEGWIERDPNSKQVPGWQRLLDRLNGRCEVELVVQPVVEAVAKTTTDFWVDYEVTAEAEREEQRKGFPVIYNVAGKYFFVGLNRCKSDNFYRQGMAHRFVKQFTVEQISTYGIVANGYKEAYQKMLRRKSLRYKLFPLDNTYVFVASNGNRLLPDDYSERVELVDDWIAKGPKGKRVGGTRDFGGMYKGARRYQKHELGKYIRLFTTLSSVTKTLSANDITYTEDEAFVSIVKMSKTDAKSYVERTWKGDFS